MKKAVLTSLIALVLVSISGCALNGQRIAKLPISSKRRQRYAMQLAKRPLLNISSLDLDELYTLAGDDIGQNNIPVNRSTLDAKAEIKMGYKCVPIPAYTLDFKKLKQTSPENYSDKLFVNDTTLAQFLNYKKKRPLGMIYLYKDHDKWKELMEEHNGSLDRHEGVLPDSLDFHPVIKGILEAQKQSSNVFIINMTSSSDLLYTISVVGYTKGGHVHIVTPYSGALKTYDNIKDWILNDYRVHHFF